MNRTQLTFTVGATNAIWTDALEYLNMNIWKAVMIADGNLQKFINLMFLTGSESGASASILAWIRKASG